MELTADQVATATFRIVRRGYDPEEVRAFQFEVAAVLDAAVQRAQLMEQRAKAAIARASQHDQSGTGTTVTHGVDHTPSQPALTSSTAVVRSDDAETIGRALVLAQRTAEQTVAEAQEQAAAIRAAAEAEALRVRSDVELESARLLADARLEARRAGEVERDKALAEAARREASFAQGWGALERVVIARRDVATAPGAGEGRRRAQRVRLSAAWRRRRRRAPRPCPCTNRRRSG